MEYNNQKIYKLAIISTLWNVKGYPPYKYFKNYCQIGLAGIIPYNWGWLKKKIKFLQKRIASIVNALIGYASILVSQIPTAPTPFHYPLSPLSKLEGMACYDGQLPAHVKGIALWPSFDFAFCFYAVLAHFRPFECTIVTLIMFSSNFSNLEKEKKKNNKKCRKIQKIQQKLPKNVN